MHLKSYFFCWSEYKSFNEIIDIIIDCWNTANDLCIFPFLPITRLSYISFNIESNTWIWSSAASNEHFRRWLAYWEKELKMSNQSLVIWINLATSSDSSAYCVSLKYSRTAVAVVCVIVILQLSPCSVFRLTTNPNAYLLVRREGLIRNYFVGQSAFELTLYL